jgi:hypothetical protein
MIGVAARRHMREPTNILIVRLGEQAFDETLRPALKVALGTPSRK